MLESIIMNSKPPLTTPLNEPQSQSTLTLKSTLNDLQILSPSNQKHSQFQKNLMDLNYGRPTHKTFTHVDLSICSASIAPKLNSHTLDCLYGSDHFPIVTELATPSSDKCFPKPKFLIEKAEWPSFVEYSASFAAKFPTSNNVNEEAANITKIIRSASHLSIPQSYHKPRMCGNRESTSLPILLFDITLTTHNQFFLSISSHTLLVKNHQNWKPLLRLIPFEKQFHYQHVVFMKNWMDENRSWNIVDYDNLTQIHMKPKEVWKPDITVLNSAGDKSDYLGDTQILLAHDGSFLWVPPVVYTAYCSLNFRAWPYDTQTCKLKVGSLALTYIDSRYLDLKDSLDYSELVQSTEWEIVDCDTVYRKQDYYNYIEFTFKLQRRSSMYGAVIFTPASCIILLALSSFWLPPRMGEKILLNTIVIVLIAAFLIYFAQLLPILADNTPLVA
ncbi:acetylcholine receptor subunit beta-type lev-1-like [Rhagoletis pomonella]|uniref:acetylcholine receptor subunit beta-type lev-1-like n=1 Tax=Rhagoletis pomonella TaxID=28610 RepID=UPI00177C5E4E|nr:acetylcholine receptor subunit beta-type lev-1-like [Rhagoletis pomonella]